MKDPNKAIKNPENTCFKCLEEKQDIITINIPALGYGSGFDCWSTRINLCEECYKLTNPAWWKLKIEYGKEEAEGMLWYEYEDEIFDFVKTLPLAGKELFYNRFSSDSFWDSQDWIDHKLGILSHEKCKKYGIISSEEIKAYRERFSICQHIVNIIYEDGSKGCRCPFGAFGKYGGLPSEHNVYDECYQCKYFIPRTTPIRDISDDDYEDYRIYYIAKLKQEEYKNKFE